MSEIAAERDAVPDTVRDTADEYEGMSIDQLETRYREMRTASDNLQEDMHRLFEHLLSRAEKSEPHCGDDDHGCNQTPCICTPIPG